LQQWAITDQDQQRVGGGPQTVGKTGEDIAIADTVLRAHLNG
jgi:hypothetical protein